MAENHPQPKRLYLFILALLILFTSVGIFILIPETYSQYYALLVAIVMMVAILFHFRMKNKMLLDDEKKAYPFWILLGFLNICGAIFLLFSPNYKFPLTFGIISASSTITALVLYRYLVSRKIIF